MYQYRKFNQSLYDLYDHKGKEAIIKLFEKYSYHCVSGITEELYKYGDLIFQNNAGHKLTIEVETKTKFDKLINNYDDLHVLPRKMNIKADFLIYINSGETSQFLIISTKYFRFFKNQIAEIGCSDHGDRYLDRFVCIPKELAKWYVLNSTGCTEMNFFDEELAKQYR